MARVLFGFPAFVLVLVLRRLFWFGYYYGIGFRLVLGELMLMGTCGLPGRLWCLYFLVVSC